MADRQLRSSAMVSRNAEGRWTVVIPDADPQHFDDSLAAELHAMELVRSLGGGELLVRDRKNRPPRRLIIRGV